MQARARAEAAAAALLAQAIAQHAAGDRHDGGLGEGPGGGPGGDSRGGGGNGPPLLVLGPDGGVYVAHRVKEGGDRTPSGDTASIEDKGAADAGDQRAGGVGASSAAVAESAPAALSGDPRADVPRDAGATSPGQAVPEDPAHAGPGGDAVEGVVGRDRAETPAANDGDHPVHGNAARAEGSSAGESSEPVVQPRVQRPPVHSLAVAAPPRASASEGLAPEQRGGARRTAGRHPWWRASAGANSGGSSHNPDPSSSTSAQNRMSGGGVGGMGVRLGTVWGAGNAAAAAAAAAGGMRPAAAPLRWSPGSWYSMGPGGRLGRPVRLDDALAYALAEATLRCAPSTWCLVQL